MASLRSLAYLFVASKKTTEYGFMARVLTPITIFVGLTVPYLLPTTKLASLQLTLSLSYELTLVGHLRGYKKALKGLILVLVFILLGLFVQILSHTLGLSAADPKVVVMGTVRLVALLLALSLLFQMLTISELRYLLEKLGFKGSAEVLALAFSQIPILMITFSEALTAVKLKLGKQRPIATVKPLVVEAILVSNTLAEALYIHGIPSPPRPVSYKGPRDIILVLGSVLASIVPLLASLT